MGYFSNGTEGAMYEEQFCSRCIHNDFTNGKEVGVAPPCPIWMAHLMFSYEECNSESNAKVMLDAFIPRSENGLGNGECTMFVADGPQAERLFGDTA